MANYRGERDRGPQEDGLDMRNQDLLQEALRGPVSGSPGGAAGDSPRYSTPEPAATSGGSAPVAASDNGQSSRAALGGYAGVGNMHGFRTDGYGGDQKAANSMKNTFGRIASRYKHAPSMVDSVMADPDFQRYFAGATKVQGGAGDKINFNGMLSDFESGTPVYEVDVLGASDPTNDSAMGWTWQDQVNDGGGGVAGAGAGMDPMALLGGGQGMGSQLDALGNSDMLAQILAQLQGAGGGGQEQELLQSILRGQ